MPFSKHLFEMDAAWGTNQVEKCPVWHMKAIFTVRKHQPFQCLLTIAHKSSCWFLLVNPYCCCTFCSTILTTSQIGWSTEWHVWSDDSFCSVVPLNVVLYPAWLCFCLFLLFFHPLCRHNVCKTVWCTVMTFWRDSLTHH